MLRFFIKRLVNLLIGADVFIHIKNITDSKQNSLL